MSTNINALLAATPKLNSSNYHDWTFDLEMIFRRAGCWDVAIGKEKRPVMPENISTRGATDDYEKKLADWEGKSQNVLTSIGLTVDQDQKVHIRDCESGPQAWAALRAIYSKSTRANRINLKRSFHTFKHDPEKPISAYINGLTTLGAKLKGIGVVVTDEDLVDVMIYSLDPSWGSIAAALMARSGPLSSMDTAAALREEEKRRITSGETDYHQEAPSLDAALAAKSKFGGKPKFGGGNGNSGGKRVCYRCQKEGHIARFCREPEPVSGDSAALAVDQDFAF